MEKTAKDYRDEAKIIAAETQTKNAEHSAEVYKEQRDNNKHMTKIMITGLSIGGLVFAVTSKLLSYI